MVFKIIPKEQTIVIIGEYLEEELEKAKKSVLLVYENYKIINEANSRHNSI